MIFKWNSEKLVAPYFDAAFYLSQFDGDAPTADPIAHYLQKGWLEGLDPSPEFSTNGYLEDHPDVARSGVNPLLHYAKQGEAERRSVRESEVLRIRAAKAVEKARAAFDAEFYLRQCSAGEAGEDPFDHYLSTGFRAGFDPNPDFSTLSYLLDNPDVAKSDLNPLLHYVTSGQQQGRPVRPSEFALQELTYERVNAAFDVDFYRLQRSDLPGDVEPVNHFLTEGWREGLDPSPDFNTRAYLDAYGDVAEAGCNPFVHYLLYGRVEGRVVETSTRMKEELRRQVVEPAFDGEFYRLQRPGVSDGADLIEHFLTQGWQEGYDPSPDFSTRAYLEAYEDIAESGLNPFVHYLVNGRAEGRVSKRSRHSKAALERAFVEPEFDRAFYRLQRSDLPADADPLDHFLTEGWREGSDPSRDFSVSAYLKAHGDVSESGANPFFHYLLYGRAERREAKPSTRAKLEQERAIPEPETANTPTLLSEDKKTQTVEREPQTEGQAEKVGEIEMLTPPLNGEGERAAQDFWVALAPAEVLKQRPTCAFNGDLYVTLYKDAARHTAGAYAHYCKFGAPEGRAACTFDQIRSSCTDLNATLAALVRSPEAKALLEAHPVAGARCIFELIALGDPVDRELSTFSGKTYLELNPDVAKAKLNPLVHYARNGRKEGRKSLGDLESMVLRGELKHDPAKANVLICVHELSRTGAPYVGRRLAEVLSKTYNVYMAARRGGSLEAEILEHAVSAFISENPDRDFGLVHFVPEGGFDGVILNSVESHVFLKWCVRRHVPAISYIHEFIEYTRPQAKVVGTALYSDHIIFSSEALRSNWRGALTDVGIDIEADTSIFAQEELIIGEISKLKQAKARAHIERRLGISLRGRRLIYGAGHVQIRKGVDLFVSTAAAAARRDPSAVFVWIGDGLNADDFTFGLWMDAHVQRQEMKSLYFLPAGPDYEPLSIAADAIFLSSRLDPLPNVVFDAARNGSQVVLFRGASGFDSPEFHCQSQLHFAGHLDVEDAADILTSLPLKIDGAPQRTARLKSRLEYYQKLGDHIAGIMNEKRERYQTTEFSAYPAGDYDCGLLFDDTGRMPKEAREAERARIAHLGRRYIWTSVGAFEAKAAELHAAGAPAAQFPVHRRRYLKPQSTPEFAVHCHAYYTDELAEVLHKFSPLQEASKLVFTTDTAEKAQKIKSVAAPIAKGDVEVVLCDNKGRDILPFIQLLSDSEVAGADDEVWLHIHLKRSESTTDRGEVWRDYMLSLLIGDEDGLSSAAQLITQADTGIVAPFDPFCVGWGKSRRWLDRFGSQFNHPLPETLLAFPLGNMFWSKRSVVRAMAKVFGADYPWPREPVPSDGSEYHLIERLWPSVARELGLQTRLVFDRTVRRF